VSFFVMYKLRGFQLSALTVFCISSSTVLFISCHLLGYFVTDRRDVACCILSLLSHSLPA
jgi:hypothetical protein